MSIKLRKTISLQEKIEIFERYLEQGNGDIDGLTVYEGKPIGQWAIQIRAGVKNESINPTEEQLERLYELGILERRIDSTIDEKIDALIDWKHNYPDIIVERRYKRKPVSEKTIEKLKELAQTEGVEFNEIEDRYKKIQSYNEYVRYRDSKGKLTDEQKKKCKEGNLGGRFGYSTEIEEIADKLKIDVKQVFEITTRYGSVDNFIQMYRDGKLSVDETVLYNNNLINNMIDMDYNPFAENYSKLLRACLGETRAETELKLFSSKNIDKALETLTTREMEVMKLRFGLIDGTLKTLEDVGQHFNVIKERIRQIEAKALRKLRCPNRANLIYTIKIDDLKKSEHITDQERTELTDLENDMFNSNLIFKHNSIDDVDFDKDKFNVIRNIREEIKTRIEKEKEQNMAKNDIAIEELNFSIRPFKRLKRAGINTIKQLASLSEEEIMKIRGLGKVSVEEIISKLEERGIKLGELVESSEVENKTEERIDKKAVEIIDIDLSVRSFYSLRCAGIKTLSDLENLTYEELMKIRNLNQNCLEEIVSKAKRYGISFDSGAGLDEPDLAGTTTEGKTDEKSKIEEIKAKRSKLKAELEALEKQTRKAKELLAEYNKIIGDDKVNTYDEAPDFKDE